MIHRTGMSRQKLPGALVAVIIGTLLLFTHAMANATSLCCEVADNGSSCKAADSSNPFEGCTEVADGTCVGGTGDPQHGGPAGCTCIAGQCVVTSSNDPAQCTNDAAAACCKAGVGNNCPSALVVAQSTPGFLTARLQKAPPTGATGWAEPRVAIDGADGRWVITNAEGGSNSSHRVIVFHSTDKGQTWAQTPADPAGQVETTADTDIVTTQYRSSTGQVITRVIAVELDSSLLRFVTSFSDDEGKTWTESLGMLPADADRPFLAVGPDDRVYLALDSFVGGNIFVQTSTDNGATFGPPVPVALPGDQAFADLQCGTSAPSSISVNRKTGRIYVVFGTRTSPIGGGCGAQVGSPESMVNPTRIWVATSPDGSAGSWTQSLAVDDSATNQVVGLVFSPAALDTDGNLYVAYPETKSSGDFTAAIRYVHAPPDLSSWSEPVTIAPIPISGTGHVLAHVIAGDPGRLDFAYMTEEIASGKHLWFSTMAQTLNGLSARPHVTEVRLSDSPAAVGTVNELESDCGSEPAKGIENGTVCFLSRFADVYGVALDAAGFLTVAWPAGSGAPDQGTFVATQVGGPSLH